MSVKQTVDVRIWTDDIEDDARQQLANVAALPFVGPWVAAMPDVHLGKGAAVGAVIPTRGAIIPAAVGVDIGCGMIATRLSLRDADLPDSLARVRAAIEQRVPVGFQMHDEPRTRGRAVKPLRERLAALLERTPELSKALRKRLILRVLQAFTIS